jgi:hypothetical protein
VQKLIARCSIAILQRFGEEWLQLGRWLDLIFFVFIRRNCWLTFAALPMESLSAIQTCETVVRFQTISAKASFLGSDPSISGKSSGVWQWENHPWSLPAII